MDKYYYLIAQLPSLFFGREPAMNVESFLVEAGKWLSEVDYGKLQRTDLNDILISRNDHPSIKSYKNFESQLLNDIVQWRKSRKLDMEYKPVSFSIAVLKEGNPLEVEIRLLEMKWAFLEELERDHHFDLAAIILYYLKLQILRRFFSFNKEKGFEKFQKLYEVNV